MDKHKPKFKQGWINSGLPAPAADKLWNNMVGFASYAFNRSHAAAYAMISYQTAYLKTHYPTEYLCAVMLCVGKDKKDHLIRCLTECKRLGIKVLPPDINKSEESFYVTGDKEIRFGLGPIKNVGAGSKAVLEERKAAGPFSSLRNFCERVDMGIVNRAKLEALIKSGCFDELGKTRATLLGAVEEIWQYRDHQKRYNSKLKTYHNKEEKRLERLREIEEGSKKKPLKEWSLPEEPKWPEIIEVDELPNSDIHNMEHDLLGFFVSSHPLDNINLSSLYSTDIGSIGYCTIEEMQDMGDDQPVSFAGVIINKKEITTKAQKQKMAFVLIEDLTGSVEMTVFAKTYKNVEHLLDDTRPLRIDGSLDITETDEGDRTTKIKVKNITLLDLSTVQKEPERIEACVPVSKADDLIRLLDKYAGDLHEVRVAVMLRDGNKIRFPIKPFIGNHKGIFMKEINRLKNGR
jgi:DNA polymerase-3 subunit alpha